MDCFFQAAIHTESGKRNLNSLFIIYNASSYFIMAIDFVKIIFKKMNRKLIKRHLKIWLAIGPILLLLILASTLPKIN